MTPQKTRLPNGLCIVSEQIHTAQSFALGVWIDVGSRDEEPHEHGMVHFIEHLVFRGTEKRTARKIANELESVGGYMNAFTSKDHTCYYTRALMQHFDLSLDMLADICQHPLFREADITKERAVITEEIASLQDEPEELVTDNLDELLFDAHPYAHSISGTAKGLQKIQRADIEHFHKQHYTPERIIVSASGNIDHDKLCKQLETLFPASSSPQQSLPKAKKKTASTAHKSSLFIPRAFLSPPRRRAEEREIRIATQQTHLCMGVVVPKPSDADYYSLSALNIVLGDGMSSRLNQVVREKHGLCYNIYSGMSEIGESLIMSVYAGFEPSKRKKTEQLIRKELEGMTEKAITPSELRRAKEQLKSSLIIGVESLSGRMNLLAKSELYMGTFESLEERLAKIEAISSNDILQKAQEYLRVEDWHTARVVPKKRK